LNNHFIPITTVFASHVENNLAMNANVGSSSHDHALPPLPTPRVTAPFSPFVATALTLESNFISALNAKGINGGAAPDQGGTNSLIIIFGAVSAGVLEHIRDNGDLTAAVDTGTGHTHTVI
jgi:hypothetical protein